MKMKNNGAYRLLLMLILLLLVHLILNPILIMYQCYGVPLLLDIFILYLKPLMLLLKIMEVEL
jgi:hypothetical protein